MGWLGSFLSGTFILIPSSNLNFIAQSWYEIIIYPNPEHEFEFYPTMTRVYFDLSQKLNFIHLSPPKINFILFASPKELTFIFEQVLHPLLM